MNEAKIQALKAALDEAHNAYEAEKARLIAAGMKSKERYEALKPLKEIEDAANAAYVDFANGEVKKGLHTLAKQAPKKGTPEHAAYKSRRAVAMFTK